MSAVPRPTDNVILEPQLQGWKDIRKFLHFEQGEPTEPLWHTAKINGASCSLFQFKLFLTSLGSLSAKVEVLCETIRRIVYVF